jgi:hypothetical protein
MLSEGSARRDSNNKESYDIACNKSKSWFENIKDEKSDLIDIITGLHIMNPSDVTLRSLRIIVT